jgi:hypothetical protein
MLFSRRMWLVQALAGGALAAGLAGCGESVDVVPVSGTLTRGGKPLAGFIVTFQPTSGRPSVSPTDQNGHFDLKYTFEKKGALRGRHKVHIQHPSDFGGGEAATESKLTPSEIKEVIAKYGSAEVTPLIVEIDGPKTLDLKLD